MSRVGRKNKAWGLGLLHCGQGHVSLQSFPFLGTTQTVVGAWLDIQNVSQLKAEVKDGTIITNKASLFTSPVSVFCRNQEADCHQREPAC